MGVLPLSPPVSQVATPALNNTACCDATFSLTIIDLILHKKSYEPYIAYSCNYYKIFKILNTLLQSFDILKKEVLVDIKNTYLF